MSDNVMLSEGHWAYRVGGGGAENGKMGAPRAFSEESREKWERESPAGRHVERR